MDSRTNFKNVHNKGINRGNLKFLLTLITSGIKGIMVDRFLRFLYATVPAISQGH